MSHDHACRNANVREFTRKLTEGLLFFDLPEELRRFARKQSVPVIQPPQLIIGGHKDGLKVKIVVLVDESTLSTLPGVARGWAQNRPSAIMNMITVLAQKNHVTIDAVDITIDGGKIAYSRLAFSNLSDGKRRHQKHQGGRHE